LRRPHGPGPGPQNFRHGGSPARAADGSRAGPPEAAVSEGETRHTGAECRHHPGQGTASHSASGGCVGPAEATPWSASSDRAKLPFISAVTGTVAFGIVDWPVALLVGGHLLARQRGQQKRSKSTADVGDSVLLVEPTDLLNEPLAPDPDAVRQPVGNKRRTANSNAALVTPGRTHGGATRYQPSPTSMCSAPPARRGRSGSATGATTVRKAATNEAAASSRWVTVSGPTCRAAARPWHNGHTVHSAVPVPRCSLSNLVRAQPSTADSSRTVSWAADPSSSLTAGATEQDQGRSA